ncbi:DUF6457 domain-containing protein [Streptomyces europaeiscabiei]
MDGRAQGRPGSDLEVHRALLLALAGDAAHGVARPAAP